MALVTIDEFVARLPRELDSAEHARATVFLDDAEEIVADALDAEGRDLDVEVASRAAFGRTVKRVIREMVAAAIMTGVNVGARSVTSTTGPTSDSVTWAVLPLAGWSTPELTDEMREQLGLSRPGPRGKFPPAPRWPEVLLP